MFICYACGEPKRYGRMITLEDRPKVYHGPDDEYGNPGPVIGVGSEIVLEQRFCLDCLDLVKEGLTEAEDEVSP